MLKRRVLFIAVILALSFTARPAAAAGKDIVKMNGDIFIPNNVVAGDVVAIGGNIVVSGKVENNVVAVGGSIILKAGSSVKGQVVAVGGGVMKEPTAEVGGRVTEVYMPRFIPSFPAFLNGGWMMLWATLSALALLGFLGLAVLLVALVPENMGTAVNALERSFVPMLLWGLLWMILVMPIAVLLAVSLVGIILIPLEILIAALGLILGYIASAIFIGKNILLSFKKVPPPFVDAILGILVLFAVGFVPVIGIAVKAIFLTAGLGAVLTSRFGTIKR